MTPTMAAIRATIVPTQEVMTGTMALKGEAANQDRGTVLLPKLL